MAKTPQELYQEREKRIQDAVELKMPDRVPIWFHSMGFFAAKYSGMTFQEVMYDSAKLCSVQKKVILEFEPDAYFIGGIPIPGGAVEVLDCRVIKWPGHGLSPNQPFQYVEGEYMKADEYDAFLDDPSDWVLRTYLPRVYGKLEILHSLPPITELLQGYYGLSPTSVLAIPPFTQAFKSLYEAGRTILQHQSLDAQHHKDMSGLGFPCAMAGITTAPFDAVSDTLRGMKGIMLDMYRQPDKLLKAIDKLLPRMIGSGIASAKVNHSSRVFIPLHRGSDGFMSSKQYETFYWPSLKALMLSLIGAGLTPCPFFEGDYTSRLHYLTELPRGKVVGLFDTTDIYKAKEVLGNTMCISCMMPGSLLQTGTPDTVKEYTRKLIDIAGKNGGFIMGSRSAMDEMKPELVKIWVDFTKEYGVYQ